MANIKFPRKEFEKEIKLTPEIEEKINMFGTPLTLSEDEVEIEIFPNRPDLIPMQGYLRALKAFIGKEKGLQNYQLKKPLPDYKVKIDSSVKDIRPFTACAIVKNLSFNDEKIKEIVDLQEKLHATIGRNRKKAAIGIYPLEKIKLPIKYEARSPKDIKFTPLEESREMTAPEILRKHPTGKEYAKLLLDCPKYPVFVDADNKILSMPPIINSNETGKITSQTKDVFVECSGSDFAVLNKILNIVVTTLADLGGSIYQMTLEYPKKEITPNLSPEKMKISLENVNKLLGLSLKESDLQKLLPKMGYNYKSGKVEIPSWRTDVLHEVDIIEDIAIAYGYENLIPEIPQVATAGSESKQSKIKSKISEILIGLGLLEISTYHLIKSEEAEREKLKDSIELQDSKTDYKILRPNLLIPALRILSENKDNEYPQNIFELGFCFNKNKSEIKESENLLVAKCPGNFTELKKILDYLTHSLDISYEIKESEEKNLANGRSGKILINNKPVGFIGEVHPETLQKWNIKMPVAVIEIKLDEILN